MHDPYPSSPRVVVGIDGSHAAVQAATWAVDEAIERNIPLWLLHAIHSATNDPNDAAAELAFAEKTVRDAIAAIESTGRPVKLEAEIVRHHPAAVLLEASRSATMVCIGSAGLNHSVQGKIGSTTAALATSAHCPVTIVPRTACSASDGRGVVLAVVDGSPASSTVLERSVVEAQLRAAPVRVLAMRQRRRTGTGETGGPDLERRLTHWRRNHPNLDIEPVSDHNGLLNYLEHLQRQAAPVQLVVVSPQRPGPVEVLLGPSGRAALEAAGCPVMICDRQWWL